MLTNLGKFVYGLFLCSIPLGLFVVWAYFPLTIVIVVSLCLVVGLLAWKHS